LIVGGLQLTATVETTPTPVKGIVCGEPVAVSVYVPEPLKVPADVGENLNVTLQLVEVEGLQLSVCTVNGAPLVAIELNVTVPPVALALTVRSEVVLVVTLP
jgi:hypothetical protein